MDKKIMLFDSIVIRLKQSAIAIGSVSTVVVLHLNLVHAPEWVKDTITLVSLVYLSFSRPAAYKE